MHVALVTHHYAPEEGAPQRRWGALVARFTALGHRVTVLCPPPHFPEGRVHDLTPDLRPGATGTGSHGETILRVRFREHDADLTTRLVDQSVTAADSVARAVRRWRGRASDRPDVIVATAPGLPSIAAGVAVSRGLHLPLVIEMRDAWPDLIQPSGVLGSRSRGLRGAAGRGTCWTITRLQSRANAVVTTTDSFAEILRSRGIRRVETIRNGAGADTPQLAPRRLVSTAHGAPEPLRILYAGTVGRSQSLATAVRAAAELQGGDPVELRIVGSGIDVEPLRRLATDLDVAVQWRDRVLREDVYEHYDWADSVLVSLRDWTPFAWTVPSKLYEAMATSRHVSAALSGEAATIVQTCSAGDVVPPEQPQDLALLWKQLANDRSRLHVGPQGREWVQRNTNDAALAERYLGLLAEVTAPGTTP
jgi:colanic acid biosynthesis glycosyl transferase WcaI